MKDAERIARIWETAEGIERVRGAPASEVDAFNAAHPYCRRGIAITPVKFGISFTATLYNQAGALVLVYRDGSVQVNHGGTEMGQGLYTKIGQIAVDALGVKPEAIRLMPTRTDKIPNTSATAASSGTDLNGAAVLDACRTIRATLELVAAALLECHPSEVRFENGQRVCRRTSGARADASPMWWRPRIASGCRCSLRGSIARRKFITTRRPARGVRFTTTRMARRFRKWRSTPSPASTACCAPTCWKTSARASRRWWIAGKSKAASYRAWAGSLWRNWCGTRKGASPPMARPLTSCHPGLRCRRNSTWTF